MKKILLTIFLVSVLASNGYGAEEKKWWTWEDTITQGVYATFHIMDWAQTNRIARDDDFYELNPILGRNASEGRVNTYMAATLIGHTWIAYELEDKKKTYNLFGWKFKMNPRKTWQYVWIVLEAGTVYRNHKIGLTIRY